MRKKIVLWGTNENDKKVLIALELKAENNKVNITTFPEESATEMFYNTMMEDWRIGKDVPFPEGHTTTEKDLSVTDSLLPETLRVDRTDIVNRASTEWHFVVLSTKLFEMYKSELSEKSEKIQQLAKFDNGLWAEMKEFWTKVQSQVFEKNLLHNHAKELKEKTNGLFDDMKKLKSVLDKEFEEFSTKNRETLETRLTEIEGKIEKGLGLKPLFEQLKDIQKQYRNAKFTRGDRSAVWDRLDNAFKEIKKKRFGTEDSATNTASGRLGRRLDGLMSAIGKMQRSIDRDKRDIDFQNDKINTTDGQLEQQIRQAKLKMIEERISSKQAKLDEMNSTKTDLEKKLNKEKEKEKIEEAKAAAKQKIAKKIEGQAANISDDEKTKIAVAAKDLSRKPKPSKKEAANKANAEKKGHAAANVDEVHSTASAEKEEVKEVVGEKKEANNAKVEDVKKEAAAKKEEVKEVVAEKKEANNTKLEDVKKDAAAKKEEVKEVVAKKKEVAKEKLEDVKEATSDKMEDAKGAVADFKKSMTDKAKDLSTGEKLAGGGLLAGLAGAAASAKDKIADKVEELTESKSTDSKVETGDIKPKVTDKKEDIKDTAKEAKEEVAAKVEELKADGESESLLDKIVDKVSDAKEALTDKVEDLSTGEKLAGGGLLAGLAGAIVSTKDKIEDQIENLTDSISSNTDTHQKEEVSGDDVSSDSKGSGLSTTEKLAGGGILAGLAGAISGVVENAVDSAKEMTEGISDKIDEKLDTVIPVGEEE